MKTPYEFYDITNTLLTNLAAAQGLGINELKKYYKTTDKYLRFYNQLSGIPQVFAQMAFHAQNAQRIDKFVAFETNFDGLKALTVNFCPAEFYNRYVGNEAVLEADLARAIQKDNITPMVGRYAKTLMCCAKYLKGFANKKALINDLWNKGGSCGDVKTLINYFRSEVPYGFGVALACDFIKELDDKFSFIAKPDVHTIDVISAFKCVDKKEYQYDEGCFKLVKDMQEIVKEINKQPQMVGSEITVYQFDRMIWLVCSENFYLHKSAKMKTIFLKKIV